MGAEWALEAEHPNVRGPGATCPPWAAPLGQGSSLLELVADPVFPPALLLRGPKMLVAPRVREARRPSPLYPQGWLTRMHSRLLWDRLAGGPGLWDTSHTLLWDCLCPAPGRAVGWTGPALRGLGLCWGRQKLGKRARGKGPGSRPEWGPPTPGTDRGCLSSVNARVGGWVLACRDRPGAREAPRRDPGRLEPKAKWAVKGQPWTLGLSQKWGGLVGPHVCFMSAVSPAEAWLPVALSAWTASCVWNCGCDLRERSSWGACPPPPPAFGGSVWGDAAPGEGSPWGVCEPGAPWRPGSQGLSGMARLRSRG